MFDDDRRDDDTDTTTTYASSTTIRIVTYDGAAPKKLGTCLIHPIRFCAGWECIPSPSPFHPSSLPFTAPAHSPFERLTCMQCLYVIDTNTHLCGLHFPRSEKKNLIFVVGMLCQPQKVCRIFFRSPNIFSSHPNPRTESTT